MLILNGRISEMSFLIKLQVLPLGICGKRSLILCISHWLNSALATAALSLPAFIYLLFFLWSQCTIFNSENIESFPDKPHGCSAWRVCVSMVQLVHV